MLCSKLLKQNISTKLGVKLYHINADADASGTPRAAVGGVTF
jgi:hypothetical protein